MVAFFRMNSKMQSTYKGVLTPLPIRMLNAIARSLKQISDKTLSLEIQNLLEKATSKTELDLSLIHISEPTRPTATSRMPSSA